MVTPSIRFRSIRGWVLLNISLINLSVVGLTIFTIVAVTKLDTLDNSFLREQDLVGAIYGRIDQSHRLLEQNISNPSAFTESSFQYVRDQLIDDVTDLNLIQRGETNARIVTDFGNMVQSYLEYAENAMKRRQQGQLSEANWSHEEAKSILGLINGQLSNLFTVITEDSFLLRKQADRVRLQMLILDVVISLVVLCLAISFVLQSFRRIISPINELTKASNKINEGALDVRVQSASKDFEFQRLSSAFNSMLNTINRQIKEIEETSRLKVQLQQEESRSNRVQALVRQAELQALQSRINPHFLFNTLNMICQSAYSEEASQSAKMIESLAAMLHYLMADSSKPVLLADEIRHTRDYFCIQELRFGSRISFSLDCPPMLDTIRVPRLIIQPIVENAIRHGAKDIVDNVQVSVAVSLANDMVSIKISDTGIGIAPGDLERIRNRLVDERQPDSNIGLHNVYQRLKLYYGEKASLNIESARGRGTTVDVRIPFSLERII